METSKRLIALRQVRGALVSRGHKEEDPWVRVLDVTIAELAEDELIALELRRGYWERIRGALHDARQITVKHGDYDTSMILRTHEDAIKGQLEEKTHE